MARVAAVLHPACGPRARRVCSLKPIFMTRGIPSFPTFVRDHPTSISTTSLIVGHLHRSNKTNQHAIHSFQGPPIWQRLLPKKNSNSFQSGMTSSWPTTVARWKNPSATFQPCGQQRQQCQQSQPERKNPGREPHRNKTFGMPNFGQVASPDARRVPTRSFSSAAAILALLRCSSNASASTQHLPICTVIRIPQRENASICIFMGKGGKQCPKMCHVLSTLFSNRRGSPIHLLQQSKTREGRHGHPTADLFNFRTAAGETGKKIRWLQKNPRFVPDCEDPSPAAK